jgi:sporulation protein YlmC with PRC-barrel domain/CBS domain-containing protein
MSELQLIPAVVATSASALLGRNVVGPDGKVCGRVRELAVDVSTDQTHVAALLLRPSGGKKGSKTLLPVVEMVLPVSNEAELRAKSAPVAYKERHEYLLLDYDLLDQQIIDVDGRKVVRVNDVNLAWEPGAGAEETAGLRIEEVEVGNRGAMRRLFKGLPVAMVDGFTGRLTPRVIPWSCVDLIERDPARRVRLKIGQERLSKLHPSDIADILEDLAPGEREAVFSSLPEETAAETLEEVDPKMQKALLQGLDSERAADILEEMDPGAAADVLAELSDEESEAILEEMEPEERQDVEDLLEFSADSAAGRMTTDYVSAPKDATVAEAIQALREFEGDPDTITEIYLLGEAEKLAGVVMLPRLVLSTAETVLATLSEGHNVRCGLDASDREVAELFDKYNLRSLPVVDHHGRVAGAIHAEQVIAQLREG